jgi:hypothetical protein
VSCEQALDELEEQRERIAALEAEVAALRTQLANAYRLREIAVADARRMALEEDAARAIRTRAAIDGE